MWGGLFAVEQLYAVHYAEQLVDGLGPQHGDARLAEVGNTLEHWRGSQMAAYVEYAAQLVDALDALAHLLLEGVNLPCVAHDLLPGVDKRAVDHGAGVESLVHLLENPRTAEASAANHDGIYAVAVEALAGTLGCCHVAVTYYRYVHARIVLHLADERPVGLAGVHLCTRAAVYGESLYAAVLQLLGKGYNDFVVGIPPEARLHRHGDVDGIDHGTGYGKHLRHVLKHSCTGTLACHALHGAAEVEVEHVGMSLVDDNARRLDHGFNLATVNLYGHRALLVAHAQFLKALVDHAHECVGSHKLRIYHRCPEPLAQQSEAYVRNVLHRGEEYGMLSKFVISNLHYTGKNSNNRTIMPINEI